MKSPQSLRSRLILIILTPLLVVSLVAGVWQFRATTKRAENIFDRGLLSAALAISRDVAISGGDALSPLTRNLINDTSGGELFYHVYAPDGVFVTGYSTPPVPADPNPAPSAEPLYFDAVYQREDVRVLRFRDVTSVDDVSGTFNITVWQGADVRRNFVREVVTRSFAVIALLVTCVALIVWFGVRLGLRPLMELEGAIARRSSTDLEPIRRAVPLETNGLVKTLNRLFDQVSRRISSKDEFISNAAHQLRNPIAGVLALAEAVESAPDEAAAKRRSRELLQAARETSRLANQLLSFERARGSNISMTGERLDICELGNEIIESVLQSAIDPAVELSFVRPDAPVVVFGDRVMLREALLNLVTNALVHGGRQLSHITLTIEASGQTAVFTVEDDGIGIPAEKQDQAKSRFGQAGGGGGGGSGLGLPIAAKVADNHGGHLEIRSPQKGTSVRFALPIADSNAKIGL